MTNTLSFSPLFGKILTKTLLKSAKVLKKDVSAGRKKIETLKEKIVRQSKAQVGSFLINQTLTAFQTALNIVPYDTGQLARSGRAKINDKVIANVTGKNGEFRPLRLMKSLPPESLNIYSIELYFERFSTWVNNPDGSGIFDVAIFTHEYLFPYGEKMARKPGRGPKYIDIAMNLHLRPRFLMRNIDNIIDSIINKS